MTGVIPVGADTVILQRSSPWGEPSILQNMVNVTDPAYGAFGDGSADDTLAILRAISALGTGGGTLYFPRGQYKFSSFSVGSNTTIKGDGVGATILKTTATSGAAITLTESLYVSLQDFSLTTNGGSEAASYGIYKTSWGGIYSFERIKVSGLQACTALAHLEDVSDLVVSNSYFEAGASGNAFEFEARTMNSGLAVFNNAIFESYLGYGFKEYGSPNDVDGITFNACFFAGLAAAEYLGSGTVRAHAVAHNGCHYESKAAAGAGYSLVKVGIGVGSSTWQNCRFIHNGPGTAVVDTFDFVEANSGVSSGVQVVGNMLFGLDSAAYVIRGGAIGGSPYHVFRNCFYSEGSIEYGTPAGTWSVGSPPWNTYTQDGWVSREAGQWNMQGALAIRGHRHLAGDAAPSGAGWGAHLVGDICWKNAPASGQPVGWACTVAGDPGTWVAFGTLA